VRPYLAFARASFDNILAYRGRYVVGIFSYLINVAVYTFIWRAVFAGSPSIGGLTIADLGTWIAVGWVLRSFYFNSIDRDLADDLAEGRLAVLLTRPVDDQAARIFRAAGESAFRIVFFSLPTALAVLLLFPVRPPAGLLAALAFLVSAFLTFFLMAGINFLVGLAAIGTRAVQGILRAKALAVELLSGLLIPIALFPDRLREVVAWLPFRHVVDTPVRLYLGRATGRDALLLLGAEALWTVGILLAGRLVYRLASPRISIAGG
jgi:ABC-2 type transport system permease protein